jgi:probable rRNA maturation factor
MIKINVITNNDTWLNYIRKPNYYLDKKINKLSIKKKEFKKNKIFCTLLLSGTKEIRHLNKKFRKKNKATDVLSFPFQTKKELKQKLKSEKEVYLGDIIINLNKIRYKNLKKNFKIEFDRLWIHGFVHLFGYEHKKEKDYKKMRLIEKEYFELVND